jgi:hypothetical protein
MDLLVSSGGLGHRVAVGGVLGGFRCGSWVVAHH